MDLTNHFLIAMHDDGDPGKLRSLGHTDRQAVDIELPPRKHACNTDKYAGLIPHEYGKHMSHLKSSQRITLV